MLEGLFVDADDDDAVVGRTGAAKLEAGIEQTLFYILKKEEAGTAISSNAGERKQQQAGHGDKHGQGDIDLSSRYTAQPLLPALRVWRHAAPVREFRVFRICVLNNGEARE